MTLKKWSRKLKKNDQKKCHLKKDKVEHVLLYHFLNNENHTQIVSPGEKDYLTASAETWMKGSSFCCTYICVYSKEKSLNLFQTF